MTRSVDPAADAVDSASEFEPSETPTPPSPRKGTARRLVVGTLNYGLGQALPQVVRFLVALVIAQVLTEADYGILELAGYLSTVLMIFMRLGVPGAVTRFYYDHREGPELSDYVTTIAIFMFCSSLVVGLITLAVGPWLFPYTMPSLPFYPYGVLALAAAFISCNQNLQDRLVQAREQSAYSAMLNIGRATVAISLLLLFVVWLRQGPAGYLWAELIAGIVIFLQAAHYLMPNLRGRFQPAMLRTSLKYAMGILPMHFMGAVAPLITGAILAHAVNIGSLGDLGFARKFFMPLTILASAFQTAFTPIYFSLRKEHTQKNADTLARTATVCLGRYDSGGHRRHLLPPAVAAADDARSAARVGPVGADPGDWIRKSNDLPDLCPGNLFQQTDLLGADRFGLLADRDDRLHPVDGRVAGSRWSGLGQLAGNDGDGDHRGHLFSPADQSAASWHRHFPPGSLRNRGGRRGLAFRTGTDPAGDRGGGGGNRGVSAVVVDFRRPHDS